MVQLLLLHNPLKFQTNSPNISLIPLQNYTDENLLTQNLIEIQATTSHLKIERNEQIKRNRIKLFHLNIRSIKKQKPLKIRELALDNKVDVLAILETWLNSSISNAEVEIQGYKIHKINQKYKDLSQRPIICV